MGEGGEPGKQRVEGGRWGCWVGGGVREKQKDSHTTCDPDSSDQVPLDGAWYLEEETNLWKTESANLG